MPALRLHRLSVLLLLLFSGCAGPDYDCRVQPVATLPLEIEKSFLVVPARINDRLVRLIVDTGAERSLLSLSAAERVGLPQANGNQMRFSGVGGYSFTTDVTLGGLVLGDVRFPVHQIAVSPFDLRTRLPRIDGLLGADILLAFDLDIDADARTLTLYRARACPAATPPWSADFVSIDGVGVRNDRLLLPIIIDGVPADAIVDTGAQRTVITTAMVDRLGLTDAVLAGDPSMHQHGVGPAEVTTRLHQFDRLQIGPLVQPSPEIAVMSGEAGFGEDFLRGRRVWLSFKGRHVYVTRRPDDL